MCLLIVLGASCLLVVVCSLLWCIDLFGLLVANCLLVACGCCWLRRVLLAIRLFVWWGVVGCCYGCYG